MIAIIGSGPSGISAAMSLVRQDTDIIMLDVGNELEAERVRKVETLKRVPKEKWRSAQTRFLYEGPKANTVGIPEKFCFGSDFVYRGAKAFVNPSGQDRGVLASFARGGLSHVWGAAILPWLEREIPDWPFSFAEMESAYRSIMEFVPLSAQHDRLEAIYPFYRQCAHKMRTASAIRTLLHHLESNHQALGDKGLVFGQSRLALTGKGSGECRYCNSCLYGCPWASIYNSAITLKKFLLPESRFTYLPRFQAEKIMRDGDAILIQGVDSQSGKPRQVSVKRVFVACGPYATARLVLNTCGAGNQPVPLRTSQYFLLPLLGRRPIRNKIDEDNFTLSQAFFEVQDPRVSPHTIHLQAYAYNDMMRDAIKSVLGIAFPLVRPAVRAFLERVFIIQGYLHSDLSPTARIQLNKSDQLEIQSLSNSRTGRVIGELKRKMWKCRTLTGLTPLNWLLKTGNTGAGNHCGGSFPMKRTPGLLETDQVGQLKDFPGLHIVDSSVLPSIPASTMTLSVMANAFRIGNHFTKYHHE